MTTVVRLKPQEFVHISDTNTSVTRLLVGPATYTLPQHESLVFKVPKPFVVLAPREYCIVENPVVRAADGSPVVDSHGHVKTQLGEKEVRLAQPPFPLYPEEKVTHQGSLQVLEPTQALVLRANRDFMEGKTKRHAGDEWLFEGPATYIPKVEVDMVERRDAKIVTPHKALRLRAKNRHVDRTGVERSVGEEYLWTQEGAYILSVDETLVNVVDATVLTPTTAVHVEVLKSFKDERPWAKCERKPGTTYLLTNADTPVFIPDPAERIVQKVNLITLNKMQYAVILDPVEGGVQQLGRRKVVTNQSLFLRPGERLENAVQDVYVLSGDEGLVLSAIDEFDDTSVTPAVHRQPGDMWLLTGPMEFIPPASVRVEREKKTGQEVRRRIVLSESEGVYIRNTQTGEVRAQIGGTVMLAATEELWEKELPPVVEEKLAQQGRSTSSYMEKGVDSTARRDRTKVIRYQVPHNTISQVYDYKKRTQRTIFGPDAVMLGPDEQFTVLNLSGSEWDPKQPNVCMPKKTGMIKSLYLFLGPASLSDVLEVETSDHARLQLQLSYDWYFDIVKGDKTQANECFSVPDFVGDCCSAMASRIRAAVASVPFDEFHKHSSQLVTAAVFGIDKATKKPRASVRFPSNRLVVTQVDVQDMEVQSETTKVALQQSVKMAIEITTQAQEAAARQEASVREQKAQGLLEKQRISDKTAVEGKRKAFIELETGSAAIESSGVAKAEAKATAEASEIEANAAVAVAKIKASTAGVLDQMKLDAETKKKDSELAHLAAKNQEEMDHAKKLADIESAKFSKTIAAIGKDTVTALARAGPEAQARLLKSLGLEGYLVTDGTNPINLFNTAKGMTDATVRPKTA